MFSVMSAERQTAVNMVVRRQAIGDIANVAKLTLSEGAADSRPGEIVDFDRCCDRKYTREEMTVRVMERRMP